MRRVAKTGGVVAVYVWDYADGMQFIRHFFDAAIALDSKAAEHDEGPRFPICHPDALRQLFEATGCRMWKCAQLRSRQCFATLTITGVRSLQV